MCLDTSRLQALERIAKDLPMSVDKPIAREFEYKRNGTQTLIPQAVVIEPAIHNSQDRHARKMISNICPA